MEQKKISQCETMTVSLDNSYPDAYLAAVNKDNGVFKNFKLSVASLISALNNKFATINSKFTTINNKFTAVNSRIDAIAAGGSSGGGSGSGSSEDPGEDPGGGEDSGEGGGTTPSGQTTDLTEVNNRLQVLENEISNFKNVNNWPVNTIKLTNNAGDIIATYDLPSNYLGRGYTQEDSIIIQVNSDASPKYDLTFELSTCDIDSENNTFTIPFRVKCTKKTNQQGGTVTGLRIDGDINTGSTVISFTGVDLLSEDLIVTSAGYNSGWQNLTVELQNASIMVITSTIQLKLNGSTDPIITLTTVCDKTNSNAVSRTVIITT